MKELKTLTPFKHLCMTIGNLPSSYVDSMSYYECLIWLCKFLKEEVIPTVNNNSEAVEELQEYVAHYFDNLDVQEEINNKLDEMLEDGTLESILMNYTKLTKVFDTYEELIIDTTLVNGMKVKTLGYHSINDNGGAYYYVSESNNLLGYKVSSGTSGLYIYLIEENSIVNVKQFGAYGDGIHDDTIYIQNAINYIDSTKIDSNQSTTENPSWIRYFSSSKTLYFPNSKYKINNTINFINSRYYFIDGNNSYIESDNNISIFKFSSIGGTKSTIKKFTFNKVYNPIEYDSENIDASIVNIEECTFIGSNIAIKYNNRSSRLVIEKCNFSWCYKIFKNIMCDNALFKDCWFSEYESTENNHSDIEILWGENKFINCMFIPNGNYRNITESNYTNLCWIKVGDNTSSVVNNPSILVDNCRISSETNSKTLINWQVVPNAVTNPSDTYIKILNSYQLAGDIGNTVVKLWHLPQQFIIENCDLRIEDNTFISLDDSLNVDNELTTYCASPNRFEYTYDYSITNCKTQTATAWNNIPSSIIGLFKNTDHDIKLNLSSSNDTVEFNIGMQSLGNTKSFNKIYLVKTFYNPINAVAGMSSSVGLLMFDAVNSTVESSSSIRVKYVSIAQYAGGSSSTTSENIDIIPTFQNDSNKITMSGNSHLKIKLKLNNSIYNNNESYITIKPL